MDWVVCLYQHRYDVVDNHCELLDFYIYSSFDKIVPHYPPLDCSAVVCLAIDVYVEEVDDVDTVVDCLGASNDVADMDLMAADLEDHMVIGVHHNCLVSNLDWMVVLVLYDFQGVCLDDDQLGFDLIYNITNNISLMQNYSARIHFCIVITYYLDLI